MVEDHTALLTNDACEAWLARCSGVDCRAQRLVGPAHACAATWVDDSIWLGTHLAPMFSVYDQAHGEVGVVALGPRRNGTPPVAISIGDDAIALAGPPADPWLRTIVLPPRDPAAFDAWVSARTNVVIGANGEPTALHRE
jgi:hypothetical protein